MRCTLAVLAVCVVVVNCPHLAVGETPPYHLPVDEVRAKANAGDSYSQAPLAERHSQAKHGLSRNMEKALSFATPSSAAELRSPDFDPVAMYAPAPEALLPPHGGTPGHLIEFSLIVAVYVFLLICLSTAMRRRGMAFSLRSAVLTTAATCFILSLPYHRGPVFAKLVQEDGFIECLTAGPHLASGAILILASSNSTCGRRRATCLIIAALPLFLCGEELDWGQRVSGQAVSAFFRHASVEGKQNFHSTVRFIPQMIGLLLFVCWVEVLPFVHAHWHRGRLITKWPPLWQVPQRHLFRAALAMILYQEVFLSNTRGIAEVGEACLALAVFVFALRWGVFAQQDGSTTAEQP